MISFIYQLNLIFSLVQSDFMTHFEKYWKSFCVQGNKSKFYNNPVYKSDRGMNVRITNDN